ncbi:MAG TPA: YbaB/EbfC family nucleoid-associated protein [Caulifigura sp.]|jgi:DNA-binding YbaB/EbfC family protein|nr:YbaB/EbfC family nucleoid-associated protein [Caulifigura sp.]
MFKQLANIAQVVNQAQAMQGRFQELKQSLEQIRVTGSAGNGLVQVDAAGDQRILDVRIESSAYSGDPRQLEQLIVQATNDALDLAKQAAAEAMQSATGGMEGMQDLLTRFGAG